MKSLKLEYMSELQELPDLRWITALKTLHFHIRNCPELRNLPEPLRQIAASRDSWQTAGSSCTTTRVLDEQPEPASRYSAGRGRQRHALGWLQRALVQARAVSKLEDVDFGSLFERSRAELLGRADEEAAPPSYCDDLFDYWPDVQHPVWYHPSTACRADASRTRGFDAWMSRNASGHALMDPVRMRNMTMASQVFGAAHLACDAHAYAAPGHRLNP
jgi:hypothetical protein